LYSYAIKNATIVVCKIVRMKNILFTILLLSRIILYIFIVLNTIISHYNIVTVINGAIRIFYRKI